MKKLRAWEKSRPDAHLVIAPLGRCVLLMVYSNPAPAHSCLSTRILMLDACNAPGAEARGGVCNWLMGVVGSIGCWRRRELWVRGTGVVTRGEGR